ncbi:MAG TPA: hypothetical protein VFC78_09825 [Tepidisphaeraceae bacterium]|nr:hypothetical protein [Tepidisphaeraceae bacterium]
MATVIRGESDTSLDAIKAVLDAYELEHPGAVATLYRQNNVSVRIRVVDQRYKSMSKGERHDDLWSFIAVRLDEDTIQDISVLLPLAPSELKSSFMNAEFEDPMPATY